MASFDTARLEAATAARSVPAGLILRWLPGLTVFAGAFLLFAVEPLMGRLLLPYFGGSASVWSACLLFFQVLLLGGYAYSDFTSRRLSARAQRWTHVTLLAAGVAFLPLQLHPNFGAGLAPALRIPLILFASVGLPYFLLSSTGPLVQVWYVRMTGAAPYRIYALSNLASLLALISYPAVVEPALSSRLQLSYWSVAFTVFALLCGALALLAHPANQAAPARFRSFSAAHGLTVHRAAEKPSTGRRVLWVLLAALPSALLLATTNHLCQNVAAIPFLWIAPLVAYLLSLILCFDTDRPRLRSAFRWLLPPVLALMGYAAFYNVFRTDPRLLVPLFTAGLFCASMVFHGELIERKPDPEFLTSFYLYIALGGAVGGALIVWLAPVTLNGVFELPILLAASAMFLMLLYYRRRWYTDVLWASAAIATLVFAGVEIRTFSKNAVVEVRDFYGALRVVDDGGIRTVVHGTVSHGAQFLDALRRDQPTLYYAAGTGAQVALDTLRRGPQTVGVIGLGAGTVAAYARPGDRYVFYEINPQVIQIARRDFSFLSREGIETVEGDGRLALAADRRKFDVLLVDAFSGDAIPTHLMTQEAMQIYLEHLQPEGILGMHISNSVLDFSGVVGKLAEASRLSALLFHTPPDDALDRSEAIWVLMSRSPERLGDAAIRDLGKPIAIPANQRLWTDDYTNLFQCLLPR